MVKSTQLVLSTVNECWRVKKWHRVTQKRKFKKTRVDSCPRVDWMCTLGSESKKVGVQNNPSRGCYFHTEDWFRAWRSVCQTRRRSYFFWVIVAEIRHDSDATLVSLQYFSCLGPGPYSKFLQFNIYCSINKITWFWRFFGFVLDPIAKVRDSLYLR